MKIRACVAAPAWGGGVSEERRHNPRAAVTKIYVSSTRSGTLGNARGGSPGGTMSDHSEAGQTTESESSGAGLSSTPMMGSSHPSYYQPIGVRSAPPPTAGNYGPEVPISSNPYNPQNHQGGDSVNIFVRGTNSGGMWKMDQGRMQHNSYFGQQAMTEYDTMLDPGSADRAAEPSNGSHFDNRQHTEFDWYGGLDNELARRAGGRKLLREQVMPAWEDGKKVNLAAHSHGGNTVNEMGGELVERASYLQRLTSGLGADPESKEYKAAQAALAERQSMIRADLAEFKATYGDRPAGGERELLRDLQGELGEITKHQKALAGQDPGLTSSVKKQLGKEAAVLENGKFGNVMYLDTPFREQHDPVEKNPEFRSRVNNFYNVYNPDDFVVRTLAGKNILSGDRQYPGFGSFGRGFEVGNEAGYKLPENDQFKNIPWHHQNRSLASPLTGSHSDQIGDGNPATPGDVEYHSRIRSGIRDQISSGKNVGPDAPSTDWASWGLRGLIQNAQKNAYDINEKGAIDPRTGLPNAHREGEGFKLDMTPLRGTGPLIGDIGGTFRNGDTSVSGKVGDVYRDKWQLGAESYRDQFGNDTFAATLGRTSGVDRLKFGIQNGDRGADLSVGTINQGTQGRFNYTTNPDGTTSYSGDLSTGGVRAHDLNAGIHGPGGDMRLHAGKVDTNNQYSLGYANAPDGSHSVFGGARFGGVRAEDLRTDSRIGSLHQQASLGSLDTGNNLHFRGGWDGQRGAPYLEAGGDMGATRLRNGQFSSELGDGLAHVGGGFGMVRAGGIEGGGQLSYNSEAGQLQFRGGGRGGGVQVKDANLNYGVRGLGSVDARLGEFTNDTVIDDVKANLGLRQGEVSVGKAEGMGWVMRNGQINSNNELLGIKSQLGFDSISMTNSIEGANVKYDLNNLTDPRLSAGFKKLGYSGPTADGIKADINGPLGANFKGELGHIGGTELNINDANVDISKRGINARVGETTYDTVLLQNLKAQAGLGNLANVDVGLGQGSYNHFGAQSASLNLDRNGLSGALDKGNYRYLSGQDVSIGSSMFGGFTQSRIGAKEISVGGVDVGHLDFQNTGKTSDINATNVGAHGLRTTDLKGNQSIGDARADYGASQLNALDLNVGRIQGHSDNFGLTGNASVEQARLDALKIQGGNASLSFRGQQLAGVQGDLQSGAGLDKAQGSYDVLSGKAQGSFQNLSQGTQINNAKINVLGNQLALPDMGYKVNASGSGNVDLTRGQAQGSLSLAGSSVNFAGRKVEVPSWAQASGGVDVSQGAANVNLGGKNGVGADLNLSKGNLDINAFGHKIDVDQGIRNTGTAIKNGFNSAVEGGGKLLKKLKFW